MDNQLSYNLQLVGNVDGFRSSETRGWAGGNEQTIVPHCDVVRADAPLFQVGYPHPIDQSLLL